jgi:hypothetical protein
MFFWNRWTCTDCFDDCRGVWECEQSLVGRVLAKGGEVDVDGCSSFVYGSALSRYEPSKLTGEESGSSLLEVTMIPGTLSCQFWSTKDKADIPDDEVATPNPLRLSLPTTASVQA